MNKILIWLAIAAVVLGGVYLLFTNIGTFSTADDAEKMMEDEMMEEDDAMMEQKNIPEGAMMEDGGTEMLQQEDGSMMEEDTMMDEGAMMENKGSYEPYAPEKLALADSGDVVLFFRATWCPTCKALDANIRSNASAIPSGVTILDVDYDNSQTLKQKYGVTYQHTLVQVRSDGSMITKWSGSPTLSALVAEIQ